MRPHADPHVRFGGDASTGEYLTLSGEHAAPLSMAALGTPWTLFLLGFADTASMMVAGLRVPERVARAGGSAAEIGALAAAFAIAQMASALAWGRLSDRVGRRRVLLAGLLVSLVAAMLLASARSVAELFSARVLAGVGSGTAGVVLASIVDGRASAAHARHLAQLSAATSLGAVVGPALVMALRDAWLTPERVIAALAALTLVVAWRRLPPPPATSRPRADRTRSTRGVARGVALLVVTYAIALGAAAGVPTMLPALLGASHAAWAVLALGAAGVVLRALAVGPLAARLGEGRALGTGLGALALALVLLAGRSRPAAAVLGLGALAVGSAIAFPVLAARLARLTPPSRRGAVLGVQQAAGGLARAAFPLALGVALDARAAWLPLVATAGAIAALAAVQSGLAQVDRPVRAPRAA